MQGVEAADHVVNGAVELTLKVILSALASSPIITTLTNILKSIPTS